MFDDLGEVSRPYYEILLKNHYISFSVNVLHLNKIFLEVNMRDFIIIMKLLFT